MSLSANPNLATSEPSGYLILFHPDFLFQSPLANRISSFEFFQYSVNEALFLAPREEEVILDLIKNIEQEYQSKIDKFSQRIIISQLTVLLEYAERFYERQFITRKKSHHSVLKQVNNLLTEYFAQGKALHNGIPSVSYLSDELNLTPGYLSRLLVTETGKSTQQHIQDKIIQTAKTKLQHTTSSVSEIAYELGFEHPSSFTKLFKKRMKNTPVAYRNSLN
jgi:AraC-like DNA-binding protein